MSMQEQYFNPASQVDHEIPRADEKIYPHTPTPHERIPSYLRCVARVGAAAIAAATMALVLSGPVQETLAPSTNTDRITLEQIDRFASNLADSTDLPEKLNLRIIPGPDGLSALVIVPDKDNPAKSHLYLTRDNGKTAEPVSTDNVVDATWWPKVGPKGTVVFATIEEPVPDTADNTEPRLLTAYTADAQGNLTMGGQTHTILASFSDEQGRPTAGWRQQGDELILSTDAAIGGGTTESGYHPDGTPKPQITVFLPHEDN